MKSKKQHLRRESGISIIELLVVAIILVASMAVFGELAVLVTVAVVTTTNKVEGLAAARNAINRISADVRQARAFGDLYGETGQPRLKFPADKNPIYGTGPGAITPAGGWPLPPWNPDMTINDSVLVLQLPVTYEDPNNSNNPNNGMPLKLPVGALGSNSPPYNMENVDTVVYEVVADDSRPGEFLLQVSRFPGVTTLTSKSMKATLQPQTVLKGLIGPKLQTNSNKLSVFSYIPLNNSAAPIRAPSSAEIETIRGVGIDLEIKNTGLQYQQGDGRFPQFLGLHTEAFMRSNRNMTLNNAY